MRADLKDWKNGWFGLELAIAPSEIDRLIALLEMLKSDPEQHFHIASDYKGTGGVGDIEIFVKQNETPENIFLSSGALKPGHEV